MATANGSHSAIESKSKFPYFIIIIKFVTVEIIDEGAFEIQKLHTIIRWRILVIFGQLIATYAAFICFPRIKRKFIWFFLRS